MRGISAALLPQGNDLGVIQALKTALFPQQAAANAPIVTPGPTVSSAPGVTTQTPPSTAAPVTSTPTPPSTTPAPTSTGPINYLPTNVTQSLGTNYEPYVEQAGNQANFPSNTTGEESVSG